MTRVVRRGVSVVAVVAVVVATAGCGLVGGVEAGRYRLTARFERAVGLYPGSPVRVIGINVGAVVSVEPDGDEVEVTIAVDDDRRIPTGATATIVPLSLLGERYVQISPVHQGGPALDPGSEITRTRVPAEFDELLRSVEDLAGAIDPDSASDLVTRMAELVDGEGENINRLLDDGSGTLEVVADKADEIGDIISSLASLSRTLKDRTGSVTELIRNYNLLAEVLVDNSDDLNATIDQLDRAVVALTGLLERHGEDLPADVEVLTQAGSTLDVNIDHLSNTLHHAVRLFQAALRAYDADHNVLRVNNQLDMGLTGEIIAARLRDRLAGLCRRLGIDACSDTTADLFTDLVGLIPAMLEGADGPAPADRPEGEPEAAPDPPASPPPAPPPAVALPPPPDLDHLLDAVLDRIGGLLDEAQRQVLGQLDAGLLEAIPRLRPEQLAALARLEPEQLRTLTDVDPTRLGSAIDGLLRADPPAQLDPLLPEGGVVDDLVDGVLGALGGRGR